MKLYIKKQSIIKTIQNKINSNKKTKIKSKMKKNKELMVNATMAFLFFFFLLIKILNHPCNHTSIAKKKKTN